MGQLPAFQVGNPALVMTQSDDDVRNLNLLLTKKANNQKELNHKLG